MNASMRRRLNAIGKRLLPRNNIITVSQYPNETDKNVDSKLDRWRAGEIVYDVRAFPVDGPEMVVVIRRFLDRA